MTQHQTLFVQHLIDSYCDRVERFFEFHSSRDCSQRNLQVVFFRLGYDLRFDFVATQAVSLRPILLASAAACLACAGVR